MSRGSRGSSVTLRVFPGLNHPFLPDASGNPAGYTGLPEKRIFSEVLGTLVDWLAAELR
ncbi:MAG: hypothetical protein ACR2F9_08830 [Longimicrobiaceae bacterium]